MKTAFLALIASSTMALNGFCGTQKTIEHCTKVDVGPYSKETCRVTDLKTKETVRTEKTCYKTEVGGSAKAGPLKLGISTGGGKCTTKTTKEPTTKKK